MSKSKKPFAVRYRDDPDERPKLSRLRFASAAEAREYAQRLFDHGACGMAVVRLAGRRYVSIRSAASAAERRPVGPTPS